MSNNLSESIRIFIDEHINIYEGEQASALLEAKAKDVVIDPQQGVVEVDLTRWEEAQRYERRTWLERGRWSFTDRNEHHRECFAGYAPLRGRKFRRGIELGCGPFTNMRFILESCDIEQVHLLDPLINDYLTHRFCKYPHRRLGGLLNENILRLPGYLKRPLKSLRSKLNDWCIGGLLGKPVTIEASMVETYQTDQRFDLVVVINVLEHCQDALKVFTKIDEILLPGGVFVYHDRIYHAQEVKRRSEIVYDAGHPLRVDQSIVEGFLVHFEMLMRAEYLVDAEFRGLRNSHYELYYVGQKKESSL